jgi:uroporphyrinogen decarboxylase
MAVMTKRERVLAALGGGEVDRPPFSFWAHNFARENSANDLVAETLRVASEFDFDFLKPQTRAQAFEEAFGAVWQASGVRTTAPKLVRPVVTSAKELASLRPVDWTSGPLGEQLTALRAIRAAVGDTPIIWTVFNPIMIARRMLSGDLAALQAAMRDHSAALRSALDAVTATMAGYARAAVEAGADGLFYATNIGAEGLLTADEYQTWAVADDLAILGAVTGAPFNMLHTCGEAVYFDIFAEYPVHAFNYSLSARNPSLNALVARTGKAVVGGVTTKPADLRLTREAEEREIADAIASTGGRHLLIAAGCSNSPAVADTVAGVARDTMLALT